LPGARQQLGRDAALEDAAVVEEADLVRHLAGALDERAAERVRGLRASASTKSHAELDEAEELDEGDPADLGARHAELRAQLPALAVVGGCCGTDHRHVAEICQALKIA
jgi:methionine synthase I (cobalamin-dependent)